MAGDIYVAKEGAVLRTDDGPVYLTRNVTTVREGHPLLAAHPTLFQKLPVTFEVPEPAAEPEPRDLGTQGRKAPVESAAAGTREARTR